MSATLFSADRKKKCEKLFFIAQTRGLCTPFCGAAGLRQTCRRLYPHEEAAPSVRCACGQGSCPTYGWPWRKLSAGRPRRVRAEHQGAPHVAVGADLTDGDIAVTTILHPPQSVTSQRGPGACASGAIATTYYLHCTILPKRQPEVLNIKFSTVPIRNCKDKGRSTSP